MAVNVAIDSVLDEIVDQVIANLCPDDGDPVSTTRPVYVAQRFMGNVRSEDALKRGIAGRTPAVLVSHAGSKSIKTTIGRRVDRVESEFSLVVCSDRQDGRDERKVLLPIVESVRSLVGARAYDQPMSPLRWTKTDTLFDSDQLLALAVSFTSRHRVDYTIQPDPEETMDSATGSILAGDFTLFCTLETAGTAGGTIYAYRVDGIDDEGARYTGQACRIETGAATLTSTNYITITWEAVDGMASYEVVRIESDGIPATVGTIGATALLTFDDTGLAITSALLPEPYTQEVEVDLT